MSGIPFHQISRRGKGLDGLVSQGPREIAYVMPHFVGMSESNAQHAASTPRAFAAK
jgi:hypothetical protein